MSKAEHMESVQKMCDTGWLLVEQHTEILHDLMSSMAAPVGITSDDMEAIRGNVLSVYTEGFKAIVGAYRATGVDPEDTDTSSTAG